MANIYIYIEPRLKKSALRAAPSSSRTVRTMCSALSKPSTKRWSGRKSRAILLMSLASGA
jgi:hypothetical protein